MVRKLLLSSSQRHLSRHVCLQNAQWGQILHNKLHLNQNYSLYRVKSKIYHIREILMNSKEL